MRRSRLFVIFFVGLLFVLVLAWASLALAEFKLSIASLIPPLLGAALVAYVLALFTRGQAEAEAELLALAVRKDQVAGLDELDFEVTLPVLDALRNRADAPKESKGKAAPLAAPAADSGVSQAAAVERERVRQSVSDLLSHMESNLENLKKVRILVMDIGSNIHHIADQSGKAALANEELFQNAQRDGEKVATEIQTLMGIKDALEAGTAVIDDLALSSRDVGPIIESIFVIARKTNMLALNAAIEAARAGEQGKGFAVVAEEVRKLAEAATVSTQKVERFVEGLREKTKSAIEVLRGASRIEDSIPVVYSISDAFINIVPVVDASQKSLADLAKLVQENIEEVRHVSSILEKSNDATEESFGRIRELVDSLSANR
jgi:methyl-accepting chemotaxis protein